MTLVLMPLFLYPLLMLGFQRFVLLNAPLNGPAGSQAEYRVGFPNTVDSRHLQYCITLGTIELMRRTGKDPLDAPEDFATLSAKQTDHLEREVREGVLDIGLRFKTNRPVSLQPGRDIFADIEIIHLPGNPLSENALDDVEARLQAASESILSARLGMLNVRQRIHPLMISRVSVREEGEAGPSHSLATLVPIILILMTITGAVYPAIDLTAGERERGTMEMLMAAPVPRLGLLFAKYVAVVTVAMLTATVNLLAMTMTLTASGLGKTLFGTSGISPIVVFQVFCLLILFAGFFSAVLLTITSFARSFKEAQAYLIPLILLSLGPGLAGLMPGVKLQGITLIIPLLNIVLLSRELLLNHDVWWSSTVVVGSTLLYASAALGIAVRTFGTQAVLSETLNTWDELFQRPTIPQPGPRISSVGLIMAVMFPVLFVLKNSLALLAETNVRLQMIFACLSTLIVFGLVPVWAAWSGKLRFAETFCWRRPRWWTWLAAMLCGVSMWPFAHELVLGLDELGLVKLNVVQLEQARELVQKCRTAPLLLVLMAFAIMPASCEEWFFRGYVFRALELKLAAWPAVLLNGLIFGLFHVVAVEALTLERLAPATVLGCVLAWIRWRSGSLWPGLLVHSLHNGFITLMFYFEPLLVQSGWGTLPEKHLPLKLLAAASVVLVVGLLPLVLAKPTNRQLTAGGSR